MLVLSRKIDEALLVNGNIEIRILEVKKGRVRLGIEAPRDVPIQRKEIMELAEFGQSAEWELCCKAG